MVIQLYFTAFNSDQGGVFLTEKTFWHLGGFQRACCRRVMNLGSNQVHLACLWRVLAVHFEVQQYIDEALWIMLEESPRNKPYIDNRSCQKELTEVMEDKYGKAVCMSWDE
jgi:hypothetical protein